MPGSVFAFLNGFGQQGWADMSIMNIEVLAGGKRYRFQSEAGTSLKDCLLKAAMSLPETTGFSGSLVSRFSSSIAF